MIIHQDARIYLAKLDDTGQVTHEVAAGRHAWLQVLRGVVKLNEVTLITGDGAAVSNEDRLTIIADGDSEMMLFDLP